MSWFDAAGFANIAKSALKGAQKTIDRALDIKDESDVLPVSTPVDPGLEDFFGNWGLTQSGNVKTHKKDSPVANNDKEKMSASLWGSFTGSFFDTTKEMEQIEKLSSNSSLEDAVERNIEHFSRSKLVVQQSEEELFPSPDNETVSKKNHWDSHFSEINLDNPEENHSQNNSHSTEANKTTNRLSVLSTESEKNSSASVDIISSSTECTSPGSDLLSLSTSSSSFGLKPTSDSVEVLGESLTSPSSLEIIGSKSTNSRSTSQHTDEYISPLDSPWSEDKSSSIEKILPDNEALQEDQDENSLAEDTVSYTSVSESTSATILDSTFNPFMKHQKMLKDTFTHGESVTENKLHDMACIDNPYPFSEAITRAPSRNTMHLALSQVNQPVLIDTQPQSSKQDMSKILQKTNVIDIPAETEISTSIESNSHLDISTDEGSQSDKTLIGSDNIMESSSDTSTTTETSSNSTNLKHLLADAMTEKSYSSSEQQKSIKTSNIIESNKSSLIESISLSQIELVPRESSPISSESRSDMVKIGSDHTSGHTSGDELETTTSSDIEIISSPNGDSSSTQSRQSPAKVTLIKGKCEYSPGDALLSKMSMRKAKGHTRELSEASSISDDSHSSEIDRLLKRISDMTEILESRECKLIDMNRRYAELQEQNSDLKIQLDGVVSKELESADVSQVTEEYTQRLSALEKKFQQAIREKDNLRKQLEQVKQEAATRMSKAELESLMNEKDEIIRELREEGEKLSKQQLQHSNIIKKLRAKEKENETTIKHLRESIESLTTESDRLKKSLAAKDEVERTQIEAVHQLTTKNKKVENELEKIKEQFDDLTQKYETAKKSLDAAKKELVEKNKATSELLMREQMLESLENQNKMTESQNQEIMNQLENFRQKLREAEEEVVKTEHRFREENNVLLKRLEEAEARNEELSQSLLEVSKPLVRQLESLQATHSLKIAAFEKLEDNLTVKIRELQTRIKTLTSSERQAKEECVSLRSKLAAIEGQQSTLTHQLEMLLIQSEQQRNERTLAEQELLSKIENLNSIIKQNSDIITEQEKQITSLQQELGAEKTSDIGKHIIETSQGVSKEKHYLQDADSSSRTASNSPTLSLGKASISESMSGSFWSQDDGFDVSSTPRYTNMFEMQILQTNLKQREGEVQQLQWQLNQREQERALLNNEISTLLTRLENLETKTKDFESLSTKFSELEQQYETLCQLYGEKVEENDELKLDLLDVKEMYKNQIDELLKQLKQNPK